MLCERAPDIGKGGIVIVSSWFGWLAVQGLLIQDAE